ncbi:proteasome activator pa28 [Crucibulum laeve]|uniref:Proteasome activator pa28 n=1 Tax=Crucibulum laeve TaxID=68775 RepID=A0A5C3LX01_9AGAR|nr:proteasome activator pa28 [Crucibulum laeve]
MEKDLANKLEVFRKTTTESGELIVFHVFPSKVCKDSAELGDLIQATHTSDSPFHISYASTTTDPTVYSPLDSNGSEELQAKKRKRLNGAGDAEDLTESKSLTHTHEARFTGRMQSNKHISSKIHNVVKKECEQLVSSVDQVKLWVTLTMPNGDNFGVQIQEEVLSELHRAQESAYNLRDAARQDYLARAKICSKILKYPNIEDYTLSLKEHDERQLFLARQHLYDIRNLYAILTDLIHKNITKIRVPKANNSIGLY